MSKKKTEQLGMNPSTAAGRLIRDILFKYISKVGDNICYRCSKSLTRETFSIEHKEPWLDSPNPTELYWDLENISFSHKECNSAAGKRTNKVHTPPGQSWCWDCKQFKNLEEFPVRSRQNNKRCTKCNAVHKKEYRRRKGK